MAHWFIATERFTSADGKRWDDYVAWSGLKQVDEVVSLDPMLCPTVLPFIKDEYWPHIVNQDFMLNYFLDLDFLLEEIRGMTAVNLLCVGHNPSPAWQPHQGAVEFEFLGYDLVDVEGGASALTNCGGFPDVFDGSELSSKGLLVDHARALEVQAALRARHPKEPHANCHVWALARAVGWSPEHARHITGVELPVDGEFIL